MNQYTIVNLVGDIFKITGKVLGFIGDSLLFIIEKILIPIIINFTKIVENIAGIFGVNSLLIECCIAALLSITLSIIPDLICFYGCRFSKEYRELDKREKNALTDEGKVKSIEAKKEYVSCHTYFLLKAILSVKEKLEQKRTSILKKQTKSLKKKNDGLIGRVFKNNNKKTSDDVMNNFLDESEISVPEETKIAEKTEENKKTSDNVINNLLDESEMSVPEETKIAKKTEENKKSNIKLIYSSNMIGNMLRNNVVLERKFLNSDRPVLIDFENKPKEVFTGHLCDKDSGIRYSKMVNGKKIDLSFDDPSFLANQKLYDELSIEELKAIRETLINDKKYQSSLNSFFAINDKALEHKKI